MDEIALLGAAGWPLLLVDGEVNAVRRPLGVLPATVERRRVVERKLDGHRLRGFAGPDDGGTGGGIGRSTGRRGIALANALTNIGQLSHEDSSSSASGLT